jgi:hypothetical protein
MQCSPECVGTLGINLVYGLRRKGSRDSFNNGPKAAIRGFKLYLPALHVGNLISGVNRRFVLRSTSVIALTSALVYSRMSTELVPLEGSANASTISRHG